MCAAAPVAAPRRSLRDRWTSTPALLFFTGRRFAVGQCDARALRVGSRGCNCLAQLHGLNDDERTAEWWPGAIGDDGVAGPVSARSRWLSQRLACGLVPTPLCMEGCNAVYECLACSVEDCGFRSHGSGGCMCFWHERAGPARKRSGRVGVDIACPIRMCMGLSHLELSPGNTTCGRE